MDGIEIAKEMLEFLNDTSQYQDFLQWAEERGFDKSSLEEEIEEKIENF